MHEVLPVHTAHMACEEQWEQGRNLQLTGCNTDNRTVPSLVKPLLTTFFQPFGKELLANVLLLRKDGQ